MSKKIDEKIDHENSLPGESTSLTIQDRFSPYYWIDFSGFLTRESSQQLMASMIMLRDDGYQNILLHIDSPGGYQCEADALYYFVKGIDVNICTYVSRRAESAATVLFMAGSERIAAPDAKFGFHGSISLNDADANTANLNASIKTRYRDAGYPYFEKNGFLDSPTPMNFVGVDELVDLTFVTEIGLIRAPVRHSHLRIKGELSEEEVQGLLRKM